MEADYLPVTYGELNNFLRRKAETELKEDESKIELELQELKEMIEKKVLPCYTDDEFLLCFLRSKKHRVKRAFDQLQKYSYQRHSLMNFYGFIDFHKIKAPIEKGVCGVLPKRDAEGRGILYLRACGWDRSVCDPDDVLRAVQTLLHFCLEYPATQVSGFCLIVDNYKTSLATLRIVLKYLVVSIPTFSTFPGRIQIVALVNNSLIMRGLCKIALALVPSKFRSRTHFYGNARTALPGLFDPGILPEEFGGTLGPISTLHHSWIDQLEHYVPKLLATNKHFKRKNTVPFPEEFQGKIPQTKEDDELMPESQFANNIL